MITICKSKEEFNQYINDELTLVDFYAEWCGPCRMMGPILEELDSNRSNVKIMKVNVDNFEDIAKEYGIMSVPSLLIFKGGKLISSKTGFMPKELLEKWIKEIN